VRHPRCRYLRRGTAIRRSLYLSLRASDHHAITDFLVHQGEERHLPRIVDLIKKGMFCFTVGRADSKVRRSHNSIRPNKSLPHQFFIAMKELVAG
jgi:hypothetical protein